MNHGFRHKIKLLFFVSAIEQCHQLPDYFVNRLISILWTDETDRKVKHNSA